MTKLMSEQMRKRWADPEWAARQRKLISDAMHASTRISEAQQNRRRVEAEERQPQARPQPWRPGEPKPDWLKRGTR